MEIRIRLKITVKGATAFPFRSVPGMAKKPYLVVDANERTAFEVVNKIIAKAMPKDVFVGFEIKEVKVNGE